MAETEYAATPDTARTHQIVRTTGGAVLAGSEVAVFIMDDTATKDEVMSAYRAIGRALSRDGGQAAAPAQYPNTTTTVE